MVAQTAVLTEVRTAEPTVELMVALTAEPMAVLTEELTAGPTGEPMEEPQDRASEF